MTGIAQPWPSQNSWDFTVMEYGYRICVCLQKEFCVTKNVYKTFFSVLINFMMETKPGEEKLIIFKTSLGVEYQIQQKNSTGKGAHAIDPKLMKHALDFIYPVSLLFLSLASSAHLIPNAAKIGGDAGT